MPLVPEQMTEEFQRRQHELLEELHSVNVIAHHFLVYGCGEIHEEALRDHDKKLKALLQQAWKVNLKFNKDKLQLR